VIKSYVTFAVYMAIAATIALVLNRVLDWPMVPSLLLSGIAFVDFFWARRERNGPRPPR
jgi:hypothetical protein